MTVEFETGLSGKDLSVDGAKLLQKGQDPRRGLAVDEDWLLFQGLEKRSDDPTFSRHSGLNLETGRLVVGDVARLAEPMLASVAGDRIKAPTILELERLFGEPLSLSVKACYPGGEPTDSLSENGARIIGSFVAAYNVMLKYSLLKRPAIELDYREQLARNKEAMDRFGRPNNTRDALDLICGDRIHALLQQVHSQPRL